jgi:hypothetical protein
MMLSCCDPDISEEHHVQLFITGLGKSLHTEVMLNDAVKFAQAYEQHDMAQSATKTLHSTGRSFSHPPAVRPLLQPRQDLLHR